MERMRMGGVSDLQEKSYCGLMLVFISEAVVSNDLGQLSMHR